MTLKDPAFLLATLGGAGLFPKVPGTMGTLVALPIAFWLQWVAGPQGLLVAAALVYVCGLWACQQLLSGGADKDPGHVVVDEAVGVWVALLPAGLDWRLYVAGFVLFRLFDIAKPWPVSWADQKVAGAQGIMLDDLLAGLMALPFMVALRVWIG